MPLGVNMGLRVFGLVSGGVLLFAGDVIVAYLAIGIAWAVTFTPVRGDD